MSSLTVCPHIISCWRFSLSRGIREKHFFIVLVSKHQIIALRQNGVIYVRRETDRFYYRQKTLSILILLAAVLGENCFLRVSWCFSEKAITQPEEQMENLDASSLFPFAYLNDTSCPNTLLLSSEFPASSALVDAKPMMSTLYSFLHHVSYLCLCVSSGASTIAPPSLPLQPPQTENGGEEHGVCVLSAR